MSLLSGKKTYIGIFIAVVPTLAGLFGYSVTSEGLAEAGTLLASLFDNVEELGVTVGGLIAIYGRAVTKS